MEYQQILNNPMDKDLSWFHWYGFGLKTGILSGRCVKVLKTNPRGYHLVKDCYTNRLFICDDRDRRLVPYFPQDEKWFADTTVELANTV